MVGLPMAFFPELPGDARPAAAASARRLLDHALALLVDHVVGTARTSWRFGPLVIVAAAENAATAALEVAAASRGASLAPCGVTTWDGASLARDIAIARDDDRIGQLAALVAASRLVVVDHIDRVDDDARQTLVHLFDISTAAGATWCVSLPEFPVDDLGAQWGSRLGGGLVVREPQLAAPRPDSGGSSPSLARVIRAVARHHDIPVEELLGSSRRRTVAVARSVAMYLARRVTGSSLQAIGAACGSRDHTTVLHGVRVCSGRIASDPAFAADVERLAVGLAGTTAAAARAPRRTGVGSATGTRAVANRHRRRRRTA